MGGTDDHSSEAGEETLRAAAPRTDFAAQQAKAGIAAALFGAEPQPETTVGRYRLESQLGAGGMGVVYRAHDPELDRPIALKVLHPEGSRDDTAQARMVREARSLAKLSHPNVIHVYDVGTEGDQVFVAMELVAGEDLKRHLDGRSLDWRQILSIFLDAGRGLQAAHDAGLVHRDFKPENVLVGSDGRVRVLDFGLARAARSVVESSTDDSGEIGEDELSAILSGATGREIELTRTGALIGTPLYMSPEQYRGAAADAASDQFSFCVALYEALYGHRPFAGGTVAVYARNVIAGDIQAPAKQPQELPGELFAALARGLEKSPGDRFPDMASLLSTLEGFLSDPAASSTVVPAPQRPRSRGVMIGFLVVATLAIGWWAKGSLDQDVVDDGGKVAITSSDAALGTDAAKAVQGAKPGNGTSAQDVTEDQGTGGETVETSATTESGTETGAAIATHAKRTRSGFCHLHEDSYSLLSRGSKRRGTLRAKGKCYRCRSEKRRSRTKRFSPQDCAGYSLCSPVPSDECP